MPLSISSLPKATIDFTNKGTGLHVGIQKATSLIEGDRNTYLVIDAKVSKGTLPIVIDTASLYILGFECDTGWYCFSDVQWNFSDKVTSLGHDGSYGSLGGLSGNLSLSDINDISLLLSSANMKKWKPALLTLVVVVAENLRLTPVRMRILGLLNGYFYSVSLDEVSRYIKNWGQASLGKDMSEQVSSTLSVGFKDPTLIRR